jgi:hypothetical protein
MALKREQQEQYASKIKINRGAGFTNMANAAKARADALDQLTNAYAKTALNKIQADGKKIGEEAAENLQFVTENVQTSDGTTIPVRKPMPKTDEIFFTKTAQETYNNAKAKRYVQEAQNSAEEIIDSVFIQATESNVSADQYDALVKVKLDELYKVLPNDVGTLVQTFAEEKRQNRWITRAVAHTKYLQDIDDEETKSEFTGLFRDLERGVLPLNEFNIKYDELKSSNIYGLNRELFDNRKRMSQFKFDLLDQGFTSVDFTTATPSDLQSLHKNLKQLQFLTSGAANTITLTNANGATRTITSAELSNAFGSTNDMDTYSADLSRVSNQLHTYLEDSGLSTNVNSVLFDDNTYTKINLGFHSYSSPLSDAKTKKAIDNIPNENIKSAYDKIHGPGSYDAFGNDALTGAIMKDFARAKTTLQLYGKLGQKQEQALATDLDNNNFSKLQTTGLNSGYLQFLVYGETISQQNNERVTLPANYYKRIDLTSSQQKKLKYFVDQYQTGKVGSELVSSMEQYLSRANEEDLPSVTEALALYTSGSGSNKYKTEAGFQQYVSQVLAKELYKFENLDFQTHFIRTDQDIDRVFKNDVISDLRNGERINDDILEARARAYITDLITNPSSVYGYSKYALNDSNYYISFGAAENKVLKDRMGMSAMVKYSPEKKFAVYNDGEEKWIADFVHKQIEERSKDTSVSDNFAPYVRKKDRPNIFKPNSTKEHVLGRMYKLVAMDDNDATTYKIMYFNGEHYDDFTDKEYAGDLIVNLADEWKRQTLIYQEQQREQMSGQ